MEMFRKDQSVTQLAKAEGVSRKFCHNQKKKADQALSNAFSEPDDSKPIFMLPVTKDWLDQLALCLVLNCHSSYRGVTKTLADAFDYKMSEGKISSVVSKAIARAKEIHAQEDLSNVKSGAHDELFQHGKPVLTGVDAYSSYCYLLSDEDQRDGETWAIHWWGLEEKGFHPDLVVGDFGEGLRKGQKIACPKIPFCGDHFHIIQDLKDMLRFVRNRLASLETIRLKLEAKMAKAKRAKKSSKFSRKLGLALKEEALFRELVRDLTTLANWLIQDVLTPAGPDLETRRMLYDFIIEEMEQLEKEHPHRIRKVRVKLKNHKEELLAFAGLIEEKYGELAKKNKAAKDLVMELAQLQKYRSSGSVYYEKVFPLRKELKHRFHELESRVKEILVGVVRTSSVVENYNSRLRQYFFLRKEIGHGYLDLLRFYLNHTPFLRSQRPERKGKTPAELLTGEVPTHWLEQLDYQRFKRAG
jgi:hypothetical protein